MSTKTIRVVGWGSGWQKVGIKLGSYVFNPNSSQPGMFQAFANFSLHCITHCESGEGILLQGEAASEAHSFRDTQPHPVIPENAKNHDKIFPKKLRPCDNTSLSTIGLCLPSTAWQ